MTPKTIIQLDNDGLNLAVDEDRLYVRCKRDMYAYDHKNISEAAHAHIFKKDGKARSFSLFGNSIYLTDFCDLYILSKNDFQVSAVYRMGSDLSSDLGAVRFDSSNAYIAMRNGWMVVFDTLTHDYHIHDVVDSSFWDFCNVEKRIYAGTVQGELLEIDTGNMQVLRKVSLGKKNIYSVVPHGQFLYTVSQDMSIKAIHIGTLEVAFQAKKAVKGMARILGVHQEKLLIADSDKVSIWNANTLQHQCIIEFPTGQYNKGIVLSGDTLFGSDLHGVYQMTLV